MRGWLRGRGWREEEWPEGERPTLAALDEVTGDVPTALRAHDGHTLWVNSRAAGAAARRGGRSRAGRSSTTTACCASTTRGTSSTRYAAASPAGDPRRGPRRAPRRARRRRHRRARQGRRARRARGVRRAARRRRADAARVAVGAERRRRPRQLREGVHGRHARLAHRAAARRRRDAADGAGRASPRSSATPPRPGCRSPCTRSATSPTARRSTASRRREDVWRPLGLRHRVEHAQCVHADDIARYARLGVTASVQYSHATSDRELAARLWADRLDRAYPYRQLLDAGVRLAGGSDAPVEDLDPLAGLRAAAECGVSRDEALACFTAAPAWLEGAEDRRGRALTRLRRRPRRARRRPRARDDGRRALGPRSAPRSRASNAAAIPSALAPTRSRSARTSAASSVCCADSLDAETDTSCERTVSSSTRIRSISEKKRSSCFSIRCSVDSCVASASTELRLRRVALRTCREARLDARRAACRRAPPTAAARASRSTPSPPRSDRSRRRPRRTGRSARAIASRIRASRVRACSISRRIGGAKSSGLTLHAPRLELLAVLRALALEHLVRDVLVEVGARRAGEVEHRGDRQREGEDPEQDPRDQHDREQHDVERVEQRVGDQRAVEAPAVVGGWRRHG